MSYKTRIKFLCSFLQLLFEHREPQVKLSIKTKFTAGELDVCCVEYTFTVHEAEFHLPGLQWFVPRSDSVFNGFFIFLIQFTVVQYVQSQCYELPLETWEVPLPYSTNITGLNPAGS